MRLRGTGKLSTAMHPSPEPRKSGGVGKIMPSIVVDNDLGIRPKEPISAGF